MPYLQALHYCPHCKSTQWGARLLGDKLWRCRKCEREYDAPYPPAGEECLQARELRQLHLSQTARACDEESAKATQAAEARLGEPWPAHVARLNAERSKGDPTSRGERK